MKKQIDSEQIPVNIVVEERRAEPRLPCDPDTHGWLYDDDQEEGRPIEIVNLSSAGICFIADRPMEPGSVVDLELRNLRHGLRCRLFVHVVYSRELSRSERICGGYFLERLPAEEFQKLVTSAS